MKVLIPLLLTLLLFNGCAKTLKQDGVNSNRWFGTYTVKTTEFFGEGSIVSIVTDSSKEIVLYSPMGGKMAEVTVDGKSVKITDNNGNTEEVSISDSIGNNFFFPINTDYLSFTDVVVGKMTPFLDTLLLQKSSSLYVKESKKKIKELRYESDSGVLELSKFRKGHFRKILLKDNDKNYFQIQYDL